MPPDRRGDLIWKLAVLSGGAVPVQEFLDGLRRYPKRLTYLLVKMHVAAQIGWGTAMAQRRFAPVQGIDDAYEFRVEFERVQIRVYFTILHAKDGVCLIALAATDEKHGRGKIPGPLRDTIEDRLRDWHRERRMVPLP